MQLCDFNYHLPSELIAQRPPAKRDASRLLVLAPGGGCIDQVFGQLKNYLRAGDLIVLNDTRVIPARLFVEKETGGKAEIMLERIINDKLLLAQLRINKTPRLGIKLYLPDKSGYLELNARQHNMFLLTYHGAGTLAELFDQRGHMPLPPYISRMDDELDQERYQTVFSKKPGAVAAPTAGLHFTNEMLCTLKTRGIEHVFLTLHVGAGTYQPVRVDNIARHHMHKEHMQISHAVANKINGVKKDGGRVIAVGTTVARALETAGDSDILRSYSGYTDIFIYPGFQFHVVDMLLTNFHLPQSTLLMLVCAFAGTDSVLRAYQHAIAAKYHFYSYGDAMLLNRNNAV